VLVVHLGGTLEKTRVQVEDVTGVSLTSGGTTEQQRHLTVSDGLLGQIVEDEQTVASVVTEPAALRVSHKAQNKSYNHEELAKVWL
jgi:hypothetical protein